VSVDLFAGISVSGLPRAVEWYTKLLGGEPAFYPNDVEAVWPGAGAGDPGDL
jgi:hypothetical protein